VRIFVHRQGGQGLVEFVLVLPILLLIVLGVIEFSYFMVNYVGVTTASREAARYGAAVGDTSTAQDIPPYADCDGIRAAARRVSTLRYLEDKAISITYEDTTGSTICLPLPPATSCCPPPAISLGDRIVVTVRIDYNPLMPVIQIPANEILSVTRRTILKGVPVK